MVAKRINICWYINSPTTLQALEDRLELTEDEVWVYLGLKRERQLAEEAKEAKVKQNVADGFRNYHRRSVEGNINANINVQKKRKS